MKSEFFKLNIKDFIRGLLMAVMGSLSASVPPMFMNGTLPTTEQLKSASIIGAGVGIGYLLKNLLTNSSDQILKKE